MKDNKQRAIKQKPLDCAKKIYVPNRIPKTLAREAWLKSKEKATSATRTKSDGNYASAQEMEEYAVQQGEAHLADGALFVLRKTGTVAKDRFTQKREPDEPPQDDPVHGDAPEPREKKTAVRNANDSDPQATAKTEQKRRTAQKQSRDVKARQQRIKKSTRGVRGVDRDQKQIRTPANIASKEKQARQAAQRTQRMIYQAQQAARESAEAAKKVIAVIRSAIQHLLAVLQSLAAALIAGGWVTVFVILLICLIALVAGSAYGIFFAAESPDENAISVQEAVELLTEEYRDRLEEIENSVDYDRQEIESNDGSYAIAWQDVLAVFASQTSGDANGAAVAYLDEDNVNRLRTVLWDMNELDWCTESQTQEMEQTNEEGETETTTITETVLIIELTHHTPEEMRETYHFTDRQNEYLTLLSDEDTTILWGELLGGFVQGSGDIMTPGFIGSGDGSLQWPLPIAGSITSPFGYRTDPISGESSYHSGTDISAPEGTPILAAAAGTVTIANATDSWGGSYGYHVKLDHGNGMETLYAHCSSICVTVGQQVQAGQVIAYVGHTGRATGSHLHFEAYIDGQRADPTSLLG